MADVPMLDINDVDQESSFEDTTLCDIKDGNKELKNMKEKMGTSEGFFQLIYTKPEQDLAITSLFKEKGWSLYSKALSEDSLNFCIQNGNEDIGTFVQSTLSETLNGMQAHTDVGRNNFDKAKRKSRENSCAGNYNNDIAEQRTKWSDEENFEQDNIETNMDDDNNETILEDFKGTKMTNNVHETDYMDYVVVKTEAMDPSDDTQKEVMDPSEDTQKEEDPSVDTQKEVMDPSEDTQKETSDACFDFNPNVSVKIEPETIGESVTEAEPMSSVEYDSETTVSGEEVANVKHDSESTLSGPEDSSTDTVSEAEHSETMETTFDQPLKDPCSYTVKETEHSENIDTFYQSVENRDVNNAKSEVDHEVDNAVAPENGTFSGATTWSSSDIGNSIGTHLDPIDDTASMTKLKEERPQANACTDKSKAVSCTTVSVAPNTSTTQAAQPYGFNTDVPSNVAQASGFQLSFPPKMKTLYDQYVQVTNLFYSTISSVNKEEQLKSTASDVPAVSIRQAGVIPGGIYTTQSTAKTLPTNNLPQGNFKPTTGNLSHNSSNSCNINLSNSSINSPTAETTASLRLNQPSVNIHQEGLPSCGYITQFPVTSFTLNSLRASLTSNKKKTINEDVFLAAHHRKKTVSPKKPANTTNSNQGTGSSTALYGNKVIPPTPFEKKDFQCLLCMKFFTSRRSVRKHVYGSHPGVIPPLDCTICCEPFATREELQRHKKEKGHRWAKTRQYQCKQCGEFMVRQEALFQHDRIPHTEPDKFPCVICKKVFATAQKANTHNRLVHVSEECTCDVCGKVFDKTRALEEHKKRHNPLNKKHMCHHCGKRFFSTQAMALHMTVHTGLKPWKCNVCGYATGVKANMNKHMKIHRKRNEGSGKVAETVPDGD